MRKHLLFALSLLAVAGSFSGIPGAAQKSAPPAAAKPPGIAKAAPAAKADSPLLPSTFSGWEATAAPKPLPDAQAADAANAAALKEYGFTDGLLGDYKRGADTLTVKALRFVDVSGAYGAYSYYRHDGWPKEEIGAGATSDRNRVLFWVGNVVVDAGFSHISTMSGSELRDLASGIPLPSGNKSLVPPILGNLPQKEIDGQTTHYALGPAGYAGAGGVLPPELVGFDRGAETATATYKLRSGPATLTLINYPTPALAMAAEKAIAAYLKAGNTPQHPFTKPLQDSNAAALEVRRSGPLVALVSGDPIQEEAHKLLAEVHFDADMAALPGGGDTDVQKTVKLFIGIITLVVVMFIAALMLAMFLGGGRALWRFARGKPISTVYDEEFTSLDLKE